MRKQTLAIILFLNTMLYSSELPTKSVVKIFASVAIPNYKYPWQTNKISNFTGSGAIINNNKILTSAHVVSGAKFIEVKKENDPKKYKANIKYISHQADLALIEIEDKSFFANTKALNINPIVKHRDEVTVLGYPLGGNAISTTSGVISRIEYIKYSWSQESLLAIQIDAAVNSGNSGGPAINKDGELVGIAMQKLTKSSNIAYIVPSIIINTFLDDVKDNIVDGFDSNSINTIKIENDNMKKFYGLHNGNGILITHTNSNEKDLKANDIILEIDNKEIANNGTIDSEFGRVNFNLLLDTKQINDSVTMKIIRDKKILNISYKLKYNVPLLNYEFEKEPRYVIFAGLIFVPLTKNYLYTLKMKESAMNMLFYEKQKTDEFNEPVAWMQMIFPHKINRGYSSDAEIIEKVNGIKVKNFKHFVELLDSSTKEYTIIDSLEKEKIVLNTKEAKESFNDLKKIYYLNTNRRVK